MEGMRVGEEGLEGERRKRESDRNGGMLIEGNRQRDARREWIVYMNQKEMKGEGGMKGLDGEREMEREGAVRRGRYGRGQS